MLEHDIRAWEIAQRSVGHTQLGHRYYWMGAEQFDRPRNVFEVTISWLRDRVDFPEGWQNAKGGLAGAEWWMNVDEPEQWDDATLHLDKDESLYQKHRMYRSPLKSTVTYLFDVGSPTLLLNMSVARGSSHYDRDMVPEIPSEGFLIFPTTNRHLIFDGTMAHGIATGFERIAHRTRSKKSEPHSQILKGAPRRMTFLVNWWSRRPGKQLCISLTDKVAEKLAPGAHTLAQVLELWSQMQGGTLDVQPQEETLVPMEVDQPVTKATGVRLRVSIESRLLGIPFRSWQDGQAYHVRWSSSVVHGGLDMMHPQEAIDFLRVSRRPVCLVLKEDEGRGKFPSNAFFSLGREFLGRLWIYVIDSREIDLDFRRHLRRFGIRNLAGTVAIVVHPASMRGHTLDGHLNHNILRRWLSARLAEFDTNRPRSRKRRKAEL